MYWAGSIVLLSLLAVAGARDAPRVSVGVGCEVSLTKKTCLAVDGCYWCASTSFSGQQPVCVDEAQAVHFPAWFFKCSHKKAPSLEEEEVVKAPQTGCDSPRTEDDCFANPACVWCQGTFGPAQAHCMDAQQAKFIPASYITCKDKKADPTQKVQTMVKKGVVPPQPGAGCANAMEKKSCLKSSACYWCENTFTPGIGARCMDETEAKFLPPGFFKCKKGKDPKPDPTPEPTPEPTPTPGPEADNAVAKAHPAPAPAPTCTDAKDSKACKNIADCAWCENTFNPQNGSLCLDAKAADFIPASVFKCKASKKKTPALSTHIVEVTPAADPCTAAMDKTSCKDVAGCAWCESTFNPTFGSRCMDAAQAAFVPATVFKCKASKKKPAVADEADPEPTPTPAPVNPCADANNADSCQAVDGCAWCEFVLSASGSGKCFKASKAKFLPPAVFKCTAAANTAAALKGAAPTPAPGADPCTSAMDKTTCKGTDGCSWCENKFNPAVGSLCVGSTQASFIPASVYKCKAAKKGVEAVEAVDPTPGPPPGVNCGSAFDKKGCLSSSGCYWCTQSYGPSFGPVVGHCYSEMEAKFLPAYMYKCKAAKQQDVVEAESAAEDDDKSVFQAVRDLFSVFSTSGNDAPPYTPPTPPTPGGAGAGCTSAMVKDACLDLTDCYWCTNTFTPGGDGRCMDAMTAKFLPDMVFKCKKGKHHKDTPTKAVSY